MLLVVKNTRHCLYFLTDAVNSPPLAFGYLSGSSLNLHLMCSLCYSPSPHARPKRGSLNYWLGTQQVYWEPGQYCCIPKRPGVHPPVLSPVFPSLLHLFIQSLVMFEEGFEGLQHLHLAGDTSWRLGLALHYGHAERAFMSRYQAFQVF